MSERGKRTFRRVLRGGGIALGAVVVAGGAFVGFLHTDAGGDWVRQKAEQRLNDRMAGAGTARIGRVRVSLASGVRVDGVVLRDRGGAPVVEVDEARVSGSLRGLLQREVSLTDVLVRGVRLHVAEVEGGGTNLSRMFPPKPVDPTAKPGEPTKPLNRVQIAHVRLSEGEVELKRLDGSWVTVKGAGFDGRLDGRPVARDLEAVVSGLGASIVVHRPGGQEISLDKLTTGIEAHLQGGSGDIVLKPLSASLGVVLPDGRRVEPTPIGLGGLTVKLSRDQILAGLQQLELLALAATSVEARVALSNGAPSGEGAGTLGGVRLDRDRFNTLLGRPVLASHVDIEARVDGSRERPALALKLTTDGGTLTGALRLDASGLARPRFELDLDSTGLQVQRIVQLADGSGPLDLGPLSLRVRGDALSREDVSADVALTLGPSTVRGVALDRAQAEGHYGGGVVTLHKIDAQASGQKLVGHGTYTIATRALDLELEAQGDGPKLAQALQKAGRTPPPVLRALRLGEGVKVRARGSLDDTLTVEVPATRVGIAGGSVQVEGQARLRRAPSEDGKGKLALDEGSGTVRLAGVRIGALLTSLGRPAPSVDGRVDGVIQLQDLARAPAARYDVKVTLDRGGEQVRAHARGRASRDALAAQLTVDRLAGGAEDRLLEGDLQLPLVIVDKKPRLATTRPLAVHLHAPERGLATLNKLLSKPLPEAAAASTASVDVQLEGTAQAPRGTLALSTTSPALARLDGQPAARVLATLTPAAEGALDVALDVTAGLHEGGEPALRARGTAHLARSPLVGPIDDAAWVLDATLAPQALARLTGKERRGQVGAKIALRGNRADVAGTVQADVRDAGPAGSPPLEATVGLTIEPEATAVRVQAKGDGSELATLSGRVELGGRGLIPRVRERKAPPLETRFALALAVPERPLASLGAWVPALQKAPGKLSGKIDLKGPATDFDLDGQIALSELPTADGAPSRAAIVLSGSRLQMTARAELRPAQGEGVDLEARVTPLLAAAALASNEPVPIDLALRASGARLSSLLPPSAVSRAAEGQLDSDLRGHVDIAIEDGKPRPRKIALQGGLQVHDGVVKIPNSARTLRDVTIKLKADGEQLTLEQLSAHESDLEQPARSIEAHGTASLQGLALTHATLDVKTQKWLLFGGNFGAPDAPRGSLDADLSVDAAFSPEGRKVAATVRSLELLVPDRYLRAHQQEKVSIGDVIEVSSAAEAGKLPPRPRPRPDSDPTQERVAVQPPSPEPPPPNPTPARPTEIEITLPPGAHIKQAPLDLRLSGTVRVKLGAGEPSSSGRFEVSGGSIFIGGRYHPVERGELRFDETNPTGYFDIWFRRSPHPAALRDVATADADAVRVHLEGPYGQQKPAYEGLGVASLFDAIAINNAGRTRYLAQPDMPTSEAAQLPLYGQLRQMTYMAVNLPHLLFLDRISVWADPYDSRQAYGRLVHHTAERYSDSGSWRVRTTSRPPRSPGQSEVEGAYELLFQNTPRTVSGVGVQAGSRLGGGPELFWEWSSPD